MAGSSIAAAAPAIISAGTALYNANNAKNANSGGGPSTGLQNAFGTPSTIYSKNPAWENTAAQNVFTNASTFANNPYQAYPGQQVAPLSSNQQLAGGNAQNAVGKYAPTYGAVTNYLNQSAQPNTAVYNPNSVGYNNVSSINNQQGISAPQQWNSQSANQYMNPYIGAALQPQINTINQQYATAQNGLNQTAAASGDYGSDRAAVQSALLTKQQQDQINGVTAQGYNTAYNTGLGAQQNANQQQLAAQTAQGNIYAQNNAANLQAQQANQAAGINTGEYNQGAAAAAFAQNQQTAQNNRLAQQAAASGLAGLTTTQQQNANSINNNLMTTGNAAQTTQQAQDTTGYQNFLNKYYYPEQQSSYLNGLLASPSTSGSLAAGPAGTMGTNGVSGLAGSVQNLYNGISGAINGSNASGVASTPGINSQFASGVGANTTLNSVDPSTYTNASTYTPTDFSSPSFTV